TSRPHAFALCRLNLRTRPSSLRAWQANPILLLAPAPFRDCLRPTRPGLRPDTSPTSSQKEARPAPPPPSCQTGQPDSSSNEGHGTPPGTMELRTGPGERCAKCTPN